MTSLEAKRHQLGVGISTTLLDDVTGFNNFLKPVEYRQVFNLHTVQSSFISVFIDYQYRFDDNWSIEVRLKYKHRHILQHLYFIPDGDPTYAGLLGHISSTYNDIAIPVTANYRWMSRSGASFELFAGAGLTTLGLVVSDAYMFGFNDTKDTEGEIGIEYDRPIDVYGLLGFQFGIPFGSVELKPFASISYSPIDNARYFVSPLKENAAIPSVMHSAPMHLCELECGIAMQF